MLGHLISSPGMCQTTAHRNRKKTMVALTELVFRRVLAKGCCEREEIEGSSESRASEHHGVKFGEVQKRNPQIQGTSGL